MSTESDAGSGARSPARGRVRTGVPGLDTLLGGGLMASGLYLVEGVPGAGKTVLGSQIAFHQARQERVVLFVTLLAEGHGKLVEHLRGFDFFEQSAISRRLMLLSGLSELMEGGLTALLAFIARTLREHRPALLVIDGFAAAREFSESAAALARFISELNALITAASCTTLLLAPLSGSTPRPEHTLVDGLFELDRVARGMRRAHQIEVHKMRGGWHFQGRHAFTIGREGLRVYPRREALFSVDTPAATGEAGRVTTGIAALDEMTSGGLIKGSATHVIGAPGTGKTLLGLTFLATGASRGEPGLYFGLYERPEQLLSKAAGVGLELERWQAEGLIHLEWRPALELLLDELGERIEALVAQGAVSRLFIDGLQGFQQSAMYPERTSRFFTALTVWLRSHGVTTVISEEATPFGAPLQSHVLAVSALVDNTVMMRYYEHGSELRRMIAVLKLRESAHDSGMRALSITDQGLHIGGRIAGMHDLVSGQPRPHTDGAHPEGEHTPGP